MPSSRVLYTATLVSILSFVFTGCLKVEKPVDTTDYPEFIVFGSFQSSTICNGSDFCVELYKMDATGLQEDTNDNEPTGSAPYNGNYSNELTSVTYNNVEALFMQNPIPQELLDHPSGSVGTISAWANNFYVEYKTPTVYKYWIIDGSFGGSVPPQIQQYLSILQQANNLAAQG